MNAYIPPSWMTGHIGCTRGPPSRRTVARNPSPTPNWYSSARPAVARSGRSVENSAQEATATQSAPTPNSGQRWPPVRDRRIATGEMTSELDTANPGQHDGEMTSELDNGDRPGPRYGGKPGAQ